MFTRGLFLCVAPDLSDGIAKLRRLFILFVVFSWRKKGSPDSPCYMTEFHPIHPIEEIKKAPNSSLFDA